MKRTPLKPPSERPERGPSRRTPLGVLYLVNLENVPEEEKVLKMAQAGLDLDEIAILLDMEETALKEQYYKQWQRGRVEAIYRISQSVVSTASGLGGMYNKEQVNAAKFWLEAKAGWGNTNERGTGTGYGGDPPDDASRVKRLARLLKFAATITVGDDSGGVELDPEPRPPNPRVPLNR